MSHSAIIGFLLPLVFALLVAGCDDAADNAGDRNIVRPLKTIVAQPTSQTRKHTYPATVLPSNQVELSFRVGGRILVLPVRAASRVSAGDVIAQLDTRDFKSELARLQSQLDQAKAQLSVMTSGRFSR